MSLFNVGCQTRELTRTIFITCKYVNEVNETKILFLLDCTVPLGDLCFVSDKNDLFNAF